MILVVDDIPAVIRLLQLQLAIQDFAVVGVQIPEAHRAIAEMRPDLVLLEVILPGISGYELMKELRERYPSLPVVFLTTQDSEGDRALAFDLGAEDYITKPFDPEELGRRISSLLQHPMSERRLIKAGDLTVDLTRELARRGNRVMSLTRNEWSLLLALAARSNERLSTVDLMHLVWGETETGLAPHLLNLIAALRNSLEREPARPELIVGSEREGFALQADITSESRREGSE